MYSQNEGCARHHPPTLSQGKPECIAIRDLIRLYGGIMSNPDLSAAAVSVVLSHVMLDAVRQPMSLAASDYVPVLPFHCAEEATETTMCGRSPRSFAGSCRSATPRTTRGS
jgi:hypothetical protein